MKESKQKKVSVFNGQRGSITSNTDTWTSLHNINYMVVTKYFMDIDRKLYKRIINFTKILSHAWEEIGKLIEICLREWGIENLFSIVVDNASSNDTVIEYLKRRMRIDTNMMFDEKYLHLRCAFHILNLIVKDGLKEIKSSIKPIRNAVLFLYSLPGRLNKLREFAILTKFSSTSTVPIDMKTRWNSIYKMLDIALKYRLVFDRMAGECVPLIKYFCENDEKGKAMMLPSAEYWDNAKAFVHFLKRFYYLTLQLSASKTPTSHMISHCLLYKLIQGFPIPYSRYGHTAYHT